MVKIIIRSLAILMFLLLLLAIVIVYYTRIAPYSNTDYLATKAFVETIADKYTPSKETLTAMERNDFDCMKTGVLDRSGPQYICYKMMNIPAYASVINFRWVLMLNQSESNVWITVLTHARFE